jgi:hypothetical protein
LRVRAALTTWSDPRQTGKNNYPHARRPQSPHELLVVFKNRINRLPLIEVVDPDHKVAHCFAVVPQVMEEGEWLRNRGQPRYPAADDGYASAAHTISKLVGVGRAK